MSKVDFSLFRFRYGGGRLIGVFSGLCFLTLVFVYCYCLETGGKNDIEIAEDFQKIGLLGEFDCREKDGYEVLEESGCELK